MIAGRREPPHHPHHRTVIYFLIATHINAFLEAAAAGIGDSLELRHQLVDLDLAILQKDLPLNVHRDGERLAILVERLGLALRQVERHADGEQRRRHHEDDEQHQHDVDARRHVDLAHDGAPAAAVPAARCGPDHATRHYALTTPP